MIYDVLVTTPLFYSSGEPHIGHAYTLIIGDLIKKYYSLIGKKAYLLTGVDEHGEKISKRARELNQKVQEFVNDNSKKFQEIQKKLDISSDYFLRTTNADHREYVLKIFENLLNNGDIYLSNWEGYNCISCETNYSQQYYSNNTKCEMGHELQKKSEEAYFLKIKNISEWITNHYSSSEIIIPQHYLKNLQQNFLDNLEDLSITRKSVDWGIKLKNSDLTIYVWFEALICYFSNPEIRKMWQSFNNKTKIVQVLGKEIIRFHSIYLPWILKTQKLKLPNKLLVHGWILNNNRKISKSEMDTNPIIPLNQLLQTLSLESIKWYFVFLSWIDDHPFSIELIQQLFNKYIVNLYSNLINRLKGILAKNGNSTSLLNSEIKNETLLRELEKGSNLIDKLSLLIENMQIPSIVQEVIILLENANKLIMQFQPWTLNTNSENYKEFNIYLYRQLVLASFLLSPIFTDEKWRNIKKALSITDEKYSKVTPEYFNSYKNFSNVVLPPINNLFEKYI